MRPDSMGGQWSRRGAVALVLASLGLVLLGFRSSGVASPGPAMAARAGAAESTAAVWHLGRLTLASCEIGGHQADGLPSEHAWCTRVAVPEDWRAAGGRRIELRVAVVRAQSRRPDPDVVTFLDGGPGGAATDDFPAVAPAFAPLAEHHHILLIDQRGTGGSNPLRCPTLDGAPSLSADQTPQSPQSLTLRLRACLAFLRRRAAPADYTTSAAVRDLEAVRLAIGAPRLDLVGISYGTRVAQQYLRRYPQAVRSMVLDSPVPATRSLLSDQAQNLERALRADFALCTRSPDCARRFGDPYATLYQLRDRLRAHPVQVQLRDPVTYAPLQVTFTAQDLAQVVRFDAYNSISAALLPLLLHAAEQGDYAPLLGQKRWLANDLSDEITSALQLSVLCAEDVDWARPHPQDAGTLLGDRSLVQAQAACSVWPHGWMPADFHAPLQSMVPTLILSGELDPVTPPAWGHEILVHLGDARQLIAPGQGHGVMGAGCIPRLVQRFVDTADPAALDQRCLARLAAPAPFLDYNGAGP